MLFQSDKEIKPYGLQRSGTNLLEFMLNNNFNVKCVGLKYGWKHAEIMSEVSCPTALIVKNPYSWFVSMYNYTTHDDELRKKRFHIPDGTTFGEFLKRSYVWDSPDSVKNKNIKVFQKSKSPIDHWNNMNKSWIKKCVTITYENLLFNPKQTLELLSKELKIIRISKKIIWPSKWFSGGQSGPLDVHHKIKYYQEEKYMSWYNKDDLRHVNKKLDKNLMNDLKYNFFVL